MLYSCTHNVTVGVKGLMEGREKITFSKKTGTASTTTADDLGKASIMYVRARQAWCIMSKLCSICSNVMSTGTTCLIGNPANVSSLPITSSWRQHNQHHGSSPTAAQSSDTTQHSLSHICYYDTSTQVPWHLKHLQAQSPSVSHEAMLTTVNAHLHQCKFPSHPEVPQENNQKFLKIPANSLMQLYRWSLPAV